MLFLEGMEGNLAYNSTSNCCFRTAESPDNRCGTIMYESWEVCVGKLYINTFGGR